MRSEAVTDEDFIIELFCRVDDRIKDVPKHCQAKMYLSELVTLGILFALKGRECRAFYRWVSRNFIDLFPQLLHRMCFFRALKQQRVQWWLGTMIAPMATMAALFKDWLMG